MALFQTKHFKDLQINAIEKTLKVQRSSLNIVKFIKYYIYFELDETVRFKDKEPVWKQMFAVHHEYDRETNPNVILYPLVENRYYYLPVSLVYDFHFIAGEGIKDYTAIERYSQTITLDIPSLNQIIKDICLEKQDSVQQYFLIKTGKFEKLKGKRNKVLNFNFVNEFDAHAVIHSEFENTIDSEVKVEE